MVSPVRKEWKAIKVHLPACNLARALEYESFESSAGS